jgi:hypothetical protein
MKYRKFGLTGWNSSILALGTARIASIHKKAAVEIVRRAVDLGINYLDLGYPYNLRNQEYVAEIIGEALQNGGREKVRIAITLPSHLIYSRAHFELHLRKQLNCLRAEKADFCLIGRLNRDNWPVLQRYGALDWAEAAVGSGQVEHVGFSFHDHFQILKTVLNSWERWRVCQFQFSYMDIDHDPGISGIRHAAEKGLAVVVSEPLRSGRLTRAVGDSSASPCAIASHQWRPAEWGLRFVWNDADVMTAIRDVGSSNEIIESAAIAEMIEPDSLTVQEELFLSRLRDARLNSRQIPCTSCRSCMPCPEGIDVPRIFEIYNDAFIYQDVDTARAIYRNELHRAERCNRCGFCEEHCVKKLPVVQWLEKALQLLSG